MQNSPLWDLLPESERPLWMLMESRDGAASFKNITTRRYIHGKSEMELRAALRSYRSGNPLREEV